MRQSLRDGQVVPLDDQDRDLWDTRHIDEGRALLQRAMTRRRTGPYPLQAAIADLHLYQPRDWRQIAALYQTLARQTASPIVEMNRAIAVAEIDGPEAGLAILDRLDLHHYRYFLCLPVRPVIRRYPLPISAGGRRRVSRYPSATPGDPSQTNISASGYAVNRTMSGNSICISAVRQGRFARAIQARLVPGTAPALARERGPVHGGQQLGGIVAAGPRGPLAAPLMGIAQHAEPAVADPQKLAAGMRARYVTVWSLPRCRASRVLAHGIGIDRQDRRGLLGNGRKRCP
jgi:hypothetical protein